MSTVAIVVGGPPTPALEPVVAAASRGAEEAGATVARVAVGETDRVLAADAMLVVAPILLYGLPGDLKSWFDGWLDNVPRVIPKTSRMQVGYAVVYAPNDPAIPQLFHPRMRALFSFFGANFRGSVAGFAPPGARQPDDGAVLRVAERLGAVLAGEPGYAGYPMEYLDGIRLFNEGEFWEAHEAWEEIWLEAEDGYRLYFQGLIQVAAALHHLARENWGGMAALLRQAIEKLEDYRPRTLGLDVDGFLAELEPWRLLAEARDGRRPVVMRQPAAPPRIELEPLG